ncbi:MAG: cytochrome c oxidase subunit 4 [Actinomycetota bacterium]|nr:MAG: cytochrome c oxidase subunit 4 [Actinomycetota bacterium]
MKMEGYLFAGGCLFYGLVALVYWLLSYDVAGTTTLALTGALAFLVAFYALFTSRRVYPRPEDRTDAEVDDADPDYGFFSPHSWWPLPTAFGAACISFGFVFAAWLVVFGVFMLFVGLVGWVFEYYRGDFAH